MKTPSIYKQIRQITIKLEGKLYSPSDMSAILYWHLIYSKTRGIPKTKELEKIAKNLEIPLFDFISSLQKFKFIKPPKNTVIPEKKQSVSIDIGNRKSINSEEIKELVALWKQHMGTDISISQKMEITLLLNVYPDLREIMKRWFQYQLEFKECTLADRMRWYLFGNKFHNFQNNIEKFADKEVFGMILESHRKRRNAQTDRIPSFGFSIDKAEDRRLAMENERESICLALQQGKEYDLSIVFPENVEFYTKKTKRKKKEK